MTAPTVATTRTTEAGPAAPLLPTAWPDVSRPEPPDRRVLVAIAVAAIGTDLALRSGVAGVAGALLVVAVAGGLLVSRRVVNRKAWPLLLVAPLFGIALATRAAGWLLALDVVAAAGLLALGASLGRTGDPTDLSIPDVLGRGLHVAVHGLLAPAFPFARERTRPTPSTGGAEDRAPSTTAAVARGALLGAPIVVVLGLLLGSADPVFASFFRFPTDGGDAVLHLVLLAVGATGAAALFRTTSAAPYDLRLSGRRFLGPIEAATVLTGCVAVFLAFTASQVAAVVGGAGYVARTAGLSYGDYARHGFFQLLAAAAITLAVLLAVRAAVRAPERRSLVWLSEAAVVLTLVLVAGAVRRLGLYEQAYGLTLLRLWSLLFAIWLGGVFVLLGAVVAGAGRGRSWFVPAAVGLALAGLLVLDVANPEALVARRNIERFAGTDRFDAATLAGLSDDAVPAIAAELDHLAPTERAEVLARLCVERTPSPFHGVFAFNTATNAAADARARVCPVGEA